MAKIEDLKKTNSEKLKAEQAQSENLKAAGKTRSNAVKGAGKALEVVAFIDTVTSMYRDMEGQVQAVENLIPSYSNVLLSMLEYTEVYVEYGKMETAIEDKSSDREYFTMLATADEYTLLKKYESLSVTFDDGYMNKTTFAELYANQGFYWASPENTVTQKYTDPETGAKVYFKGYFPCNLGNLIGVPAKKIYYADIELSGGGLLKYSSTYRDTISKCKTYSKDIVLALYKLAGEYNSAANNQMNDLTLGWAELLPTVGIVATAAKGVKAAYDSIGSLLYLTYQDLVISGVSVLDAAEGLLATTRELIQLKCDNYKIDIKVNGEYMTVTYITYNTAKERWYSLCNNKWKYTYYFEDGNGNATGGSMEMVLPDFPSGHPIGLNYDLDYTGKVEKPDQTWTYFSYSVDSNGTIMGWNLDDYGYNEGEKRISRKLSASIAAVQWKSHCLDPQIDPAGYIYEAVLSNRVEGATAKLYTADSEGNEVLWDGTMYGETNPQITDVLGYYSWMTPSGLWKVRVEKEGYLSASSEDNPNATEGWLPVPPPQLDINIGLVSTEAPIVKTVTGYTEGAEVVFSQYMDIESFGGKVTLMVDGTPVDCVLTFTDREQAGSGEDIYYGRTLLVSRQDGLPLAGNVTVKIDGSVRNYAGTALGEDYESEALTVSVKPRTVIFAQENYNVALGNTLTITGRVTGAEGQPAAGAEVTLSVAYGSGAALKNIYVIADEDGFFSFEVKGGELGSTRILAVCGEAQKTVVINTVEAETAETEAAGSAGSGNDGAESSELPYVTIIRPDGTLEKITESCTVTVPRGTKLSFGSYLGTVGYTTEDNDREPWWCEDYTVYTARITAAETTYRLAAKEDGKNYSQVLTLTVEFSEVLPGDADGDGNITADDAIFLLNYTLDPAGCELCCGGDTNGDGIVNSDDAIYLLNYTLDKESYPLGG